MNRPAFSNLAHVRGASLRVAGFAVLAAAVAMTSALTDEEPIA